MAGLGGMQTATDIARNSAGAVLRPCQNDSVVVILPFLILIFYFTGSAYELKEYKCMFGQNIMNINLNISQ